MARTHREFSQLANCVAGTISLVGMSESESSTDVSGCVAPEAEPGGFVRLAGAEDAESSTDPASPSPPQPPRVEIHITGVR